MQISGEIMAVVASRAEQVLAGGAPVFVEPDEATRQRVAMFLGRITDGMVHDLENGVLILVRH
ncbi:MAG: hypothetical protein AB1492_09250 [Bacillota bacterium]